VSTTAAFPIPCCRREPRAANDRSVAGLRTTSPFRPSSRPCAGARRTACPQPQPPSPLRRRVMLRARDADTPRTARPRRGPRMPGLARVRAHPRRQPAVPGRENTTVLLRRRRAATFGAQDTARAPTHTPPPPLASRHDHAMAFPCAVTTRRGRDVAFASWPSPSGIHSNTHTTHATHIGTHTHTRPP
jgi:hypothetical protein